MGNYLTRVPKLSLRTIKKICREHDLKLKECCSADKCDYCVYSETPEFIGERFENNKNGDEDYYLAPVAYVKFCKYLENHVEENEKRAD